MNLALWLERTAAVAEDSPALVLGDRVVADYAGFQARAAALARALAKAGIGPGDRVAAFMKNCPEYSVVFYAVWRAGAVIVPMNAKLHAREAAWIIGDFGAKLGFVTADNGAALAAETDVPLIDVAGPEFAGMTGGAGADCVARDLGDLLAVLHLGHDRAAEGVRITHGMAMATSLAYLVDVDPVTAADAALYAAPMSHGAGIYAPIHVRMARHRAPAW